MIAKSLVTLVITLQEQPSLYYYPHPPIGQNFKRWIHEWKLMQHLENCLPTDRQPDLPTTEDYFSFQLSSKIIVFLYCRYKMKYNCSRVSVFKTELSICFFGRGKCRKGRNLSKCNDLDCTIHIVNVLWLKLQRLSVIYLVLYIMEWKK